MLGLQKGTVNLTPHRELWHQLFAEEEARLREAIGEHVIAIEHIGSTAVCGLSAKPIIDIAAAVCEAADAERCVKPLEDIGYEYRGESGIAGRYYFVKGEPRTHHLHMVRLSSDLWRSHLLFRNYLRQNREVAEEYESLKRDLAEKYKRDREAYTDGKTTFIEEVLKKAGL
ncbi:MAG TPA: GrpB family protein [Pyrinomonadaceae bacterium]